jgi:hypothetical protein
MSSSAPTSSAPHGFPSSASSPPIGSRRDRRTLASVPPVPHPDDRDERLRALETEVAQLRTAMASRAVIEQAKGVLMLLTGCSDERSFQVLTHISSHTHRKVRDVAGELVASAAGRAELPADVREILRDACPPPRRTG